MLKVVMLSLFACVVLAEVLWVVWLAYKLRWVLAAIFIGYLLYTAPQSMLFFLVLSVLMYVFLRLDTWYRKKKRRRMEAVYLLKN